jgi:hypothetical protein
MTDQLFTAIAKEHLSIEILETRRSDSLDFHDVSVWGVRAALEAAYKAGANAERNAPTITVLENCIEKAGDLYAAIDGVTDQFDDELRALTKSSDAAVKLANKLRRGS